MKTLKRIIVLVLLANLLSAASCDTEEESCNECISAQEHYYQALLTYNCQTLNTAPARQKVVDACTNGSTKANNIQTACATGSAQPAYTCD